MTTNNKTRMRSKKIAILTDDAQLEKELNLLLSQNNFTCVIAKDASYSVDCDLVITDRAELSQKAGAIFIDNPVFSHARLLENVTCALEDDLSVIKSIELDFSPPSSSSSSDLPCLHIGTKNIKLTKNEAAILDLLLSNRGRAVDSADLSRAIGADKKPRSNETAVYIRYLRKKLESASAPCAITTVRGKGYMLK